MTVCGRIKRVTGRHERIANLAALLALLLFGTIWVAIEYQRLPLDWMSQNAVIHGPSVILAVAINVAMVILFLSIGSSQFSQGDNDTCSDTFHGRRHGGTSFGAVFRNWIHHMEHVNKKHR